MDKLFNNHWFVKMIAFFIALMLFTMVNIDDMTNQAGLLPTNQATYTLEEVELSVLYNDEVYELIDYHEHVQVTLKGPQTSITLFQLARGSYEVIADVSDRGEGAHTVSIEHRGFPSDLSVTVDPQYVRVELQEKQTVSLPVQVEFMNEDDVVEGYSLGTPIVSPVNIEVTAARDQVSQVKHARAYIDVSEADQTIEDAAPVQLYDENGNELDLEVEPAVVDITVPVTSPNRTVPTRVTRVGDLPEGMSIDELEIEPEEVTIYGPLEVIDNINVISVGELDLSDLDESQTIEMTIPLPNGVESVSPEIATVEVSIAEEETEEFENISIDLIGGSDEDEVTFMDDIEPSTTVIAQGAADLLERMTADDIQAFVDVSQLSRGEHDVDIQINGPPHIRFQIMDETIPVQIQLKSE
ncbi:YbbR-like domain-containing protein [Halalkalibacter sp. APA_J-10(15)]|uniref:CdaR family protein n=1 Tax=unclassified Halalkalibacter TaxID=2893063 RepID=UPI001FF68C0C|nr:CdaR family protein [Halalkalibacter sp. APA_J-10(15)]MCK0473765.1 CdaR family protein [Halalkalibacter sp. APA_J-10(15)]